ncbi:MAG: VOC family protein [Proteobacteria bacterium]|nr:VOC family protein [Pseudomonadota bacterium]
MDLPVNDQTPINDEMDPVDVKAVTPLNNPELLACGTMVTTDLGRARRFHEEYYGLECVRHRPDGILVRDRGRQPDGHRNGNQYWVWEVIEKDKIEFPQTRDHHWGVDVATKEDVERAFQIASENQDRWGFKIVQRVVAAPRGDYVFKIRDVDDNWWEIQWAPERIERYNALGGFGPDGERQVDDSVALSAENPALRAYFMSHGTIPCGGNGVAARRFYAEFLGIGQAQKAPHIGAFGVDAKRHWYVACLAKGNRINPQPADNRWVYAVSTSDEVDQFYRTAVEYQDKYRIQEIQPPVEEDGARFARVRDLDGSWLEFQYRDAPVGRWYDREFERGDVV